MQEVDPAAAAKVSFYSISVMDYDNIAKSLQDFGQFDELNNKFDAGETSVRNTTVMTSNERQLIMDVATGIMRPNDEYEKAAQMVVYLLNHSVDESDYPAPNAGINFLYDTNRLAVQGVKSAILFAELFSKTFNNVTIDDALRHIGSGDAKFTSAQLIQRICSTPMNRDVISYLTAERAVLGEQSQVENYGDILNRAKSSIAQRLLILSAENGLGLAYRDRALGQIQRTTFSALDCLAGGITVDETDCNADYGPMSLRVELKYEGTIAKLALQSLKNLTHSSNHEVAHASSAQDQWVDNGILYTRMGLWLSDVDDTIPINEAITEYLTQDSLGFPGLIYDTKGNMFAGDRAAYPSSLLAIMKIKHSQPAIFATLYCAYYGQVTNTDMLSNAFKIFHNEYNRMLVEKSDNQ